MKNQIIIIALLAFFTFGAELSPLQRSQAILAEVYKTDFGKSMISLVHLQSTTSDDQQDIMDLLDQIKLHIENEKDYAELTYNTQKGIEDSMIEKTKKLITSYEDTIKKEEKTYNDDGAELTKQEKQESDLAEEKRTKQADKKKAQSDKKQEQSDYDDRTNKDEEAVFACNEAIGMLQAFCDEFDEDDSSIDQGEADGPMADLFLQVHSDLQSTFNDLEEKHSSYIPMIKALAQMGENADQETVKKVITLIEELRDQIIAALQADAVSHASYVKTIDLSISNLQSQIKVTKEKHDSVEKQIGVIKNRMEQTAKTVKLAKEQLKSAQETLAAKEKALTAMTKQFNDNQALRDKQLAILARIVTALSEDTGSVANFIQKL